MAYRKSKQRIKGLARARKDAENRASALGNEPWLELLDRQLDSIGNIFTGYDGESEVCTFLESKLDSLIFAVREKSQAYDPARIVGCLKIRSYIAAVGNDHKQRIAAHIDYPLSLVEAATLIIYCDSEIDNSVCFQEPEGSVGGWDGLAEEIFELLGEIRTVITLLQLQRAAPNSAEAFLNAKHAASRQWIRETTYSSVQNELNENLLGAPEVDEHIRESRDYSFWDVHKVFEWLSNALANGFGESLDEVAELSKNRLETGTGDLNLKRMSQAFAQVFAPHFERITVSSEQIARDTRQSPEIIHKILNDFSLELTDLSTSQVSKMLADGSNPFFEFPLVRERMNRFLIPDEALLAPSVKRNLEVTLLENGASSNRYTNHRGSFVENRLAQLLKQFLPTAELKENINYRPRGDERGEADVVLLFDSVAIIFEAKSGTIFKPGEPVSVPKFRRQMRQNIHRASKQVEKLRKLIEEMRCIPTERGEHIDLADVREVHTVIVTLDDLLDLSTQPLDLIASNVLEDNDQLPWIVSIGDLDLILRLIDEPSELLVYLRRRRDPMIANKFKTSDELDMFQTFRRQGLWVENKLDADVPALVMPMTEEIDSWVHGVEESKPTIKETPLLEFVRQVRVKNMPHWFEFGATLLSIDEYEQIEIQDSLEYLHRLTSSDSLPHSLTLVFSERPPT